MRTYRNSTLVIFLLSLFLSFILYGNTIDGEFVYDDAVFSTRPEMQKPAYLLQLWGEPLVHNNPATGIWRPLLSITFALNYLLFGESPASFHILNIIANGIATFFVYLFIKRLSNNTKLGICSALFFAFFPIHTGSVAFIKARDEILSTILILLSWIYFLKTVDTKPNPKFIHLGMSVFFFALALLMKEQSVMAPMFFVGLEVVRSGIPPLRSLFLLCLPYGIMIGIYILVRYLVLGEYLFAHDNLYFTSNVLQDSGLWVGIWTAFKIAFVYIGKTFIPINLSATYTYNHLSLVLNPLTSLQTILGLIFIALLITLIFWNKTRRTPLAYGATIFLLCYLPVSRFIFKGSGEILEENWMYLPTLGLSLIAGYLLLQSYQRNKTVAVIVASVIFLIYGTVTINRNNVWHNKFSLYHSMVASAPDSISGYFFLADIYYSSGDYNRASEFAEKAYRIYPDHPRILNLQAKLLMLQGQYKEAEYLLLKSMSIRSGTPESNTLYARILAKQGRYTESLNHLLPFLAIDPDHKELHYLIALNLYKLGKSEEAKKYFDWRSDISEAEKIKLLELF